MTDNKSGKTDKTMSEAQGDTEGQSALPSRLTDIMHDTVKGSQSDTGSAGRVDETGEIFSEKLKAFTLELVDFKDKPEAYPKSQIEYWLYNLVNMESMTEALPFQAQQPIFCKMGGISELSHMDSEERRKHFNGI